MRLNFLEYLGYGEDCGNGMRYKETACSTLHAVNHIGWGKKQPKGTYATVCQNSSADSGFSGEPSRILPQQSGKTPPTYTIGNYRQLPKPYRLKASHLCTAPLKRLASSVITYLLRLFL